MKKYSFLLLFCSAFLQGYALTDLPTKTYSKQDTSLAVKYLFADKRSSGKTLTMVGGMFVMGGLIGLPVALPVGIPGLVEAGFGLNRQIRFSRRREEILLNNYQAGATLPKRIQRRLKARYFG